MDIEMKFTATLTEEDLTTLITQVFNKKGYDVDDITINVAKRYVGHQMNEYEEVYFKNIEVKIRQGDKKNMSKKDKPITGGWV